MGKIILTNLPKSELRGNSYYYADLHMDLQDNFAINSQLHNTREINDFKLDYDVDAIKNSLNNLFTTTPGQKILNPQYGLDLKQYIFAPATVDTAEFIRDEIYTQVGVFEPRVKITNVHITIMEDVNEFDISIYYTVPSLNIHNISMFGTLGSNGYIYQN